jgi:hypothetical protein
MTAKKRKEFHTCQLMMALQYKGIFSMLDNGCMERRLLRILHHGLISSRVIMRMRSGSPRNCLMQRDKYCLGAPSC